MLARTLRARALPRHLSTVFRASYSDSNTPRADSVHQVPANDPNPRPAKPNVSATNAVATSSEGAFDKVLQESVERGQELRVKQSPNQAGIWSRSQQPREVAMSGPRFEQTIFEDQVCACLFWGKGESQKGCRGSGRLEVEGLA
jgi:NADH dehydrogenase (ubiquinone) Fe-S protein 6